MRDVELKKALRSDNFLNIKVTNCSGKEFELCLCPSQSVQHLKEKVSGDNPKDGAHFKLLSMNSNRILDEKKTLEEEGINDNDELLLVRRRKPSKCINDGAITVKGPDASKIDKLTAQTGDVKGSKVTDVGAVALHFDFNRELQRILITLIDAAHLVQFDNKTSEEDGDKENSQGKTQCDLLNVNKDELKQLIDMGYTAASATKALYLNRKAGVQGAMEWLLQHESDPDIDEPLQIKQKEPVKPQRRREFIPNRKGVENLKDMGFSEEDVIKALRATGNDQRAACECLLGERHDVAEDQDPGLDTESPLYAAIMDSPAVQLSLTNPRILAAFQEMQENPSANGHFITDPETGPVLLQISRIVQGFAR